MPRLDPSTTPRPKNMPPRSRASRTVRGKKPQPQQDRLSQRRLLWRRIKRSFKPGLWVLGGCAVIVVGVELVRSLPSPPPAVHKPVTDVAALARVTPAVSHEAPVMQPGLLANALAGLGFRITKIEVHGISATDPVTLAHALVVKKGDPTFGFSLSAIQQRVDMLGPVQQVTIERLLPGTLVVNVTERDVYAIWQTIKNGQPVFQLIDKKGDIIAGQDAAAAKRREPSLLLLSGVGAPQQASVLIPALKAVPTVYAHVEAAQRVDDLRWNLILKDHTVVKLPAENMSAALVQLAALQASMQLLDRPVQSIDLRQPGRLVVRPYVIAPPKTDRHNQVDRHQEGQ